MLVPPNPLPRSVPDPRRPPTAVPQSRRQPVLVRRIKESNHRNHQHHPHKRLIVPPLHRLPHRHRWFVSSAKTPRYCITSKPCNPIFPGMFKNGNKRRGCCKQRKTRPCGSVRNHHHRHNHSNSHSHGNLRQQNR